MAVQKKVWWLAQVAWYNITWKSPIGKKLYPPFLPPTPKKEEIIPPDVNIYQAFETKDKKNYQVAALEQQYWLYDFSVSVSVLAYCVDVFWLLLPKATWKNLRGEYAPIQNWACW